MKLLNFFLILFSLYGCQQPKEEIKDIDEMVYLDEEIQNQQFKSDLLDNPQEIILE